MQAANFNSPRAISVGDQPDPAIGGVTARGDDPTTAIQKGQAMAASQPTITLNNGVELPALGFGVFQTPPDVTQAAVEEALRVGYRMVDTAASYLNEREVGAAIAASGIDRSALFVQTNEAHRRLGIATQAWSPLGGVYVYRGDEPRNALADPVITSIAERYGKTPAQIVLRWHIDSGRSAIPKSVTPSRIAENLAVFDFALTTDDIAAIDALDTGVRGGPNQDLLDFRTFDRTIPE